MYLTALVIGGIGLFTFVSGAVLIVGAAIENIRFSRARAEQRRRERYARRYDASEAHVNALSRNETPLSGTVVPVMRLPALETNPYLGWEQAAILEAERIIKNGASFKGDTNS
jgi:hypothetical protein